MNSHPARQSGWNRAARARVLRCASVLALAISAAGCDAGDTMKTHHDPLGFVVRMPADWISASPARTDIALGDPAGEVVALVRARLAPGNLARWLAHDYPRTEPAMRDVQALRAESVQA